MKKLIDLKGKKFGKLTVIKRVKNKNKKVFWLCRCDCGNYKKIAGPSLRSGNTKSCGCLKIEKSKNKKGCYVDINSIVGMKFGRWTVIKRDFNRTGKESYWICKCDCGVIRSVNKKGLKNGSSKSCGCLQKELTSKKFLNDLTGKRFGRLLVIKKGKTNKYGFVQWLCKCDCGVFKEITGMSLINGSTKSCGCLHREITKNRKGKKHPNYIGGGPTYNTYKNQLWFENIRRDPNNKKLLQIKCYNSECKKWFNPTYNQIWHRITSIKNINLGECHFYCSEECKKSCCVFWQQTYPKDFKSYDLRNEIIDPKFRELVLKKDKYKCQKCFSRENLEVHHIAGVIKESMLANDIDYAITLCKNCHDEIHNQSGCGNNEYYKRKPCLENYK